MHIHDYMHANTCILHVIVSFHGRDDHRSTSFTSSTTTTSMGKISAGVSATTEEHLGIRFSPQRALEDVDSAMNLMQRLREAGIRSHFWI